ncbi:hypothetical protein [Bradyrhizobium neotropicale]|uniref:Uncharacterized protein n=1 Tax=Bradyrhizobium neotropicale TaxID=1497615 RepID=A0A176YYF9_9BRAD|nr:hypothetical protein [Bradyrhizobium neotropicale]OAF12822.1 hypothetical protein AXW67_19635 [Bradyrhizobium neotropicale]
MSKATAIPSPAITFAGSDFAQYRFDVSGRTIEIERDQAVRLAIAILAVRTVLTEQHETLKQLASAL